MWVQENATQCAKMTHMTKSIPTAYRSPLFSLVDSRKISIHLMRTHDLSI